MKPTIAKLIDENIIISNPKAIGRFHSKSKIGTKKANILYLDPLEAVFLLEEKKIKVFSEDEEYSFKELLQKAAQKKPSFETQYLIYRDLRHRGCQISIIDHHTFSLTRKHLYLIFTFSENNITTIYQIKKLCEKAIEKQANTWIAVVDEEGDITYYEISIMEPKGEIHSEVLPKTKGTLLNNRVILFNQKHIMELHKKEFYGKPFEEGLQLSLIEALYLMQEDLLTLTTPRETDITNDSFQKFLMDNHPDILLRFPVYRDLKNRGLIVKTGFKFGTHFRAYTNLPDETHAEYLIHLIKPDEEIAWAEISRGVRLAHAVRKTFLFAFKEKNDIIYLKLARIRP